MTWLLSPCLPGWPLYGSPRPLHSYHPLNTIVRRDRAAHAAAYMAYRAGRGGGRRASGRAGGGRGTFHGGWDLLRFENAAGGVNWRGRRSAYAPRREKARARAKDAALPPLRGLASLLSGDAHRFALAALFSSPLALLRRLRLLGDAAAARWFSVSVALRRSCSLSAISITFIVHPLLLSPVPVTAPNVSIT